MSDEILPIPESWRSKVAGILRKGEKDTVFVRQRARRDWESLPGCPFEHELLDSIANALAGTDEEMKGKRHEMAEPGETYAFIFYYGRQCVYCKANLTDSGEVVIVYSAHRPLKGNQLS